VLPPDRVELARYPAIGEEGVEPLERADEGRDRGRGLARGPEVEDSIGAGRGNPRPVG
jgi:hypothetical protein